jgi:hypothetical protein
MIKLILKIWIVNIGLFILLIVFTTFTAFSLGYGSKDAYNNQLLILYSLAALVQIGINYIIYKKQIALDWRILIIIIVIIIMLYIIYPVMIQ